MTVPSHQKRLNKIRTAKISVMVDLQNEFSNFEWTKEICESIMEWKNSASFNGVKQQMRLQAFELLKVALK